jgi:hypothetical protein
MVELVTGSGVYVFDKNIAQAFKVGTEKETGTYSGEKMARYLLNVFWSRKELVGATLSKAGRGKKILNQQIIEAILGKLPLLFYCWLGLLRKNNDWEIQNPRRIVLIYVYSN